MRAHRRDLLKAALGLAGAGLFGPRALAAATAPRSLSLHNLHTGESLRATYFEDGAYLPDALEAMNHLLRDFRTGEAHPIAPGLLDLVSILRNRVESDQTVQVISGYRSPATNAALRERSHGVAAHSLHMQGMAMDIRLPGVDLAHLRDAALDLRRGGVGYYPDSDFVHVDVGRVRRW
ncbi:MAG TPA: DUF882 domain-containing protein [Phenylobacterium sp.]|uniref:DUF882 domain-containing protein n=1 Tax=Phenylobacterium sp. TaxID=1871053 RepID=UPI002C026150|nr:DUF882 domain-containing protein [Phenylobacterium sp.]HSV02934.1 DUF882 domain-containing protein [Phenylobacterium sp.]